MYLKPQKKQQRIIVVFLCRIQKEAENEQRKYKMKQGNHAKVEWKYECRTRIKYLYVKYTYLQI